MIESIFSNPHPQIFEKILSIIAVLCRLCKFSRAFVNSAKSETIAGVCRSPDNNNGIEERYSGLMMTTYLIWDAGGTLFDTYPATTAAAEAALRSLGQVPPSPKQLMGWFHQTLSFGMQRVAEMYRLDVAQFAAQFATCYDQMDVTLQPPFPGVVAVCREMCRRGGQNFIITHRDRASLQKLLDAHTMAGYFTAWVTAEDPFPRKPAPASILALLQRYALAPSDGLAIGDRDLDVQAGRNAGLRTCFFGKEPHTTPADLAIVDYNELYEWLWPGGET